MNAHTLHDCIVDYIRSYLDIQKKNKVLDIGCGTGIFLKKIQEQKTMNRKITMFAVDKAPAMVQSAQKIIDAKNVVVADIGDLPYKDNTFDVVTALHVLHHVSDKESAMLEMQRVTKK